jgi:multidrug resistance protein MdtO
MVPPAERTMTERPRLLFLAAPGRLDLAARLALICALTTLVAQYYETPEPALTAYLAFFLNRPDRATSVLLSVAMTVIVTIVLGLTVLVAQAVVNDPPARVASMAAISFVLLFLVSASKLRPVASSIALIMAFALDELGAVPGGELATRGVLYAWLFVAIPAAVSIAVNLLVGPSPRKLVQQALAERLSLAARVLRDPELWPELARVRREGDEEVASRLKLAGAERTSPMADIAALRQAADATIAAMAAVQHLAFHPSALLPAPLREALARTLDDMADILARGGYPVGVEPPATAPASLHPLARAAFATLGAAIARFAEPVPPSIRPAPAPESESPAPGFLARDAFTNPEHVHFALKTTGAAMACYIAYSLLDWPGIHTCLITCYIVSLGTLADSVEKLVLRVAGCLVGAALGTAAMVFILPSFTSIGALLAIVFVGTLVAAWIAAGSPRIAYAGFQMAFAFFLCVIQGAGPAFDLTIARDRTIGILFGNAMVYLVSAHCWPVSVAGRMEENLSAALRHLGLMLRAGTEATRRRLAAEAQAELGAVATDLQLARYEPAAVRPAANWLDHRRAMAAGVDALGTPLLLAAETGSGLPDDIARRIECLANGAVGEDPPATMFADGDALRSLVEENLRSLERASVAARRDDEVSHAAA